MSQTLSGQYIDPIYNYDNEKITYPVTEEEPESKLLFEGIIAVILIIVMVFLIVRYKPGSSFFTS